jgi:hypothetical protein
MQTATLTWEFDDTFRLSQGNMFSITLQYGTIGLLKNLHSIWLDALQDVQK